MKGKYKRNPEDYIGVIYRGCVNLCSEIIEKLRQDWQLLDEGVELGYIFDDDEVDRKKWDFLKRYENSNLYEYAVEKARYRISKEEILNFINHEPFFEMFIANILDLPVFKAREALIKSLQKDEKGSIMKNRKEQHDPTTRANFRSLGA